MILVFSLELSMMNQFNSILFIQCQILTAVASSFFVSTVSTLAAGFWIS